MNDNNIFFWANKELTQDAIIACVLSEKNEVSISFLEDILNNNVGNKKEHRIKRILYTISHGKSIDDSNKEIVKAITSDIDVFVSFEDTKGQQHAVIIEDKVDTFLHDNQPNKYTTLIKKTNKYKYIHFVLFKTGPYFFWEKSLYREEAHEQSNNSADINITFYEYLISDFISFIARNKKVLKFTWIEDYYEFIQDKLQKNNNEKSWLTEYDGTTDDFANAVIDKRILKGTRTEYEISLPVSARGKREYEFKIFGICGKSAENKKFRGKENSRYYLLPVIKLHSDNSTTCFLNIHRFCSSKNKEGYFPGKKGKCIGLRKKAIKIAEKEGLKVPNMNKSSLKICETEKKSIIKFKKDQYDFSEVKKEFNKILKLAIVLKREFDNID